MPGINDSPAWILSLVIAGMIAGAGLIALVAFQDSTTAGDLAYEGIGNATDGISNLTEQLPTVGTIMGVGLILGVVVSAFVGVAFVVNRFGGGGGTV